MPVTSQEDFFQLLDAVRKGRGEEREQALTQLHSLAAKSEIRDFDWFRDEVKNIYASVIGALNSSWIRDLSGKVNRSESLCIAIWSRIVLMPEFLPDVAYSIAVIDDPFIERAVERIVTLSADKSETAAPKTLLPLNAIKLLQHVLLNIYQHNVHIRSNIRKYLSKYLLHTQSTHRVSSPDPLLMNDTGDARNHVSYLLQILHALISGFIALDTIHPEERKENENHIEFHYFQRKELLLEILIPLHLPNEMIVWRDQVPVLQLYHEDLCRCLITLIEKSKFPEETDAGSSLISFSRPQGTLLTDALKAILPLWPDSFNNNTPKQVLLLHEVEILVERCSDFEFSLIQRQLLARLVQCIGTNADNIRPAQRALQYFKNPKVLALLLSTKMNSVINPQLSIGKVSLIELLPALYRGGNLSWNPTVNKMTSLALKGMMDYNQDLFAEVCNQFFGNRLGPGGLSRKGEDLIAPEKHRRELTSSASLATSSQPEKKQRMLPPTSRPAPHPSDAKANPVAKYMTKLDKGSQPPVTITGVAPWARNPSATTPMDVSADNGGGAKSNPPITITGVAPWKHTALPNSTSVSSTDLAPKPVEPAQPSRTAATVDGKTIICGYMRQCYEEVFSDSGSGDSKLSSGEWNQIQLANKPQLLPTLKFHDLVFGQVLGDGAFSIVKYARHITKGKSQSQWPEYAVKVIDAKKVIEFNYSLSVIREICILQAINHPNIARLISAFQFHQSAYLVLEYAKQGDLHTFLINQGKITDHSLLRFVIGEIAAGLSSIHELGFCYNDLKPENILITELGHIKITDFGACRPMNEIANKIVLEHVNHLLFMRNGNWKDDDVDETFQEDNLQKLFSPEQLKQQFLTKTNDRCEGTAAYMPPETFSAEGYYSEGTNPMVDAWALGCVLYFCFYGKPPFYGDPAQVIEQMDDFFQDEKHHHHLVHFQDNNNDEKLSSPSEGFNSWIDVANLSCEELIFQLLRRDINSRLSIGRLLDHPYITRGFTPRYESAITSLLSAESLQSNCPLYQPTQLYAQKSPPWPLYDTEGKQSAANDKWARRQFSSLWAPMPPQYSLQGSNHGAVSLSPGIKSSIQDDLLVNLLLLRQPLPVVEEKLK